MSADPRTIAELEQLIAECEKHLRHYADNPHLQLIEHSPGQPEVNVMERENQRDRELIAEYQRIIDRLKREKPTGKGS
jgi:hypothetical protein